MAVLAASTVAVGLLCLLNLFLTFGLIRRLRRRGGIGAGPPAEAWDLGASLPGPGHEIGPFLVPTTDGRSLSGNRLLDGTLVAFLAPECKTCRERLPELVAWAREHDRERVIAVLDGQVSDVSGLAALLDPVARVVVETKGRPLRELFRVSAFPAYCLVSGGKVQAASLDLAQLPAVSRS
ncbi:hypothetical protein [Nonomuraea candida]|uniref:hypothetical protein n=1 Tax=Nonomuraea candida TaxID=359159 RepID=UPI0005B829D4|nr:hypothetical protein [Nonomuraea candida]